MTILTDQDAFVAAWRAGELARQYEAAVELMLAETESLWLPGVCVACDAPSRFLVDRITGTPEAVNFRERLVCPGCGLNNRQRFVAGLVRGLRGRVYLAEQITPFFAWAERELPDAVGSEYLDDQLPPGTVREDGLRHEDALALSFADASCSAVISNDVLEHVPDIDRALAEAARVLVPGGRLIFSVPFWADRFATVRRAEIRDGRVVDLLPAQYHGNPVDPEGGSLVFWDFGWDLLDRCRSAGFGDAHAIGYWSAELGYLGGGLQLVFVATR